jgi:muramoyltetrapeptide carboxypeptidase
MELVRPRAIRAGGTIAIAAPAGPVDPAALEAGANRLRGHGFEVIAGDGVLARSGYLAGDDRRRADEFMGWITDSAVDAIVCARGGYGCHRIMSSLDAEVVRKAAKPLVGYSDIVTLLLWQQRFAGLTSIHGPMLERGDDLSAQAVAALCHALTGDDRGVRLNGTGRGGGRAEGRLCGGSLSVSVASLGTPWEIDTQGCILMLEDLQEAPYRIDRMLQQLRAAGKLDGSAVGVAFGGLVNCDNARYPRPTASEVVCEMLEPLGLPWVTDLPFGHVNDNRPWPHGGRASIDGDRGEIVLLESSLER